MWLSLHSHPLLQHYPAGFCLLLIWLRKRFPLLNVLHHVIPAALNPIVCGLWTQEIKQGIWKFLRRSGWWQKVIVFLIYFSWSRILKITIERQGLRDKNTILILSLNMLDDMNYVVSLSPRITSYLTILWYPGRD